MPDLVQLLNRLPLTGRTRLAWRKRAIACSYAKDAAAAKDADEKGRIESTCRFELGMIEEEEDGLYSKRLIRKAACMHVPLPDRTEKGTPTTYWEQGSTTGEWFLSAEGCKRLRELLREERRGQWETVTRWIALLGALAAFVAAVTGVMNMLRASKMPRDSPGTPTSAPPPSTTERRN